MWWEVSSCCIFQRIGVYLSEMDLSDICNQSILLHEVIHALQINSELEDAFKEKEYELQNKFLEELSLKNDMIKFGTLINVDQVSQKKLF